MGHQNLVNIIINLSKTCSKHTSNLTAKFVDLLLIEVFFFLIIDEVLLKIQTVEETANNGATARNRETAKNGSQKTLAPLEDVGKTNNSKKLNPIIVRNSFSKRKDGGDVASKSESMKGALLKSMVQSNGTNAGNINIQKYYAI